MLALVMMMLALPALAANTRTSGLYTYEIKGNGTITITDFNWAANGKNDIFIPNLIDGYTVTGIGDSAFCRGDDDVTVLDYAHFCRHSLSKQKLAVTIPDTIKTIGKKAFWLANISAINIPDSVEFIDSGAFYGCIECLYKVSPKQPYFAVIGNGLYNKAKKELITYSYGVEDGWERSDINLPEGIVSIGDYAMVGLSFCGIAMPATLKTIGKYAFAQAVFYSRAHCSISFYVSTIGENAFEGTRFDAGAKFYSLESIGSNAFSQSSGGIQHLEGSFSEIPDRVFYYCGTVVTDTTRLVTIGKNNNSLGKCFKSPSDFSPLLTTIPSGLNPQVTELPATITTIESAAFKDAVSGFKLPASIERIAVDAFPANSTFVVESGSYAELWCSENGFGYSIEGQNNLDFG